MFCNTCGYRYYIAGNRCEGCGAPIIKRNNMKYLIFGSLFIMGCGTGPDTYVFSDTGLHKFTCTHIKKPVQDTCESDQAICFSVGNNTLNCYSKAKPPVIVTN